jgi:hypothetical protein
MPGSPIGLADKSLFFHGFLQDPALFWLAIWPGCNNSVRYGKIQAFQWFFKGRNFLDATRRIEFVLCLSTPSTGEFLACRCQDQSEHPESAIGRNELFRLTSGARSSGGLWDVCSFRNSGNLFQRPVGPLSRPKLPLAGSKSNFRFTPQSRLNSEIAACPKSADSVEKVFFVFSLQMRLPLPGLFRVSGCDAAGLCNQVRHTEPL